MNITYYFDLPPTLNEIIAASARNRFVGGKLKKDWTHRIANETADTVQFPGKVWMEFTWYLKRFTRDPDNIQSAKKYILDGLQGIKDKKSGVIIIPHVLKEDSLRTIQSPIVEWFEKGKEDRVKVFITEDPKEILQRCVEMYESLNELSA